MCSLHLKLVELISWVGLSVWCFGKKSLNFLGCIMSEDVLAVNINSVGWTKCCLKLIELLLNGIFGLWLYR